MGLSGAGSESLFTSLHMSRAYGFTASLCLGNQLAHPALLRLGNQLAHPLEANLGVLGVAWRVRGGEIGDIGGGSLEPPRRWLGAPWLDPTLGVPSCPEPPGAPRGGTGGELGHCEGGALTMLQGAHLSVES